MKDIIYKDSMLTYHNPNKPYVIETCGSDYQMGVSLIYKGFQFFIYPVTWDVIRSITPQYIKKQSSYCNSEGKKYVLYDSHINI